MSSKTIGKISVDDVVKFLLDICTKLFAQVGRYVARRWAVWILRSLHWRAIIFLHPTNYSHILKLFLYQKEIYVINKCLINRNSSQNFALSKRRNGFCLHKEISNLSLINFFHSLQLLMF